MEDLIVRSLGSKVIRLVTRNRGDTKRMNQGAVDAVGLIAIIAALALVIGAVKIFTDT